MKKLIIFIVLFFITCSSVAGEIEGIVTNVIDGDTIIILDETTAVYQKIRLYGIDAPEHNQYFGPQAKNFLENMTYEKEVKVRTFGIDIYGRQLGIVYTNNICINKIILENGLAWVYKQYCRKNICVGWKEAETNARNKKMGLWGLDNPTPPWQYRRGTISLPSGYN